MSEPQHRKMTQLYLAWTRYIRRPVSMKDHFQYNLVFVSPLFDTRLLRPVNYFVNSIKSFWYCLRQRPTIIWIQLAPTVLLYVAFLYKKLIDPEVRIIADCHNSMFNARWLSFPWALQLLNSCDLVLTHNDVVLKTALSLNVDPSRLHRLETKPAQIDCRSAENAENTDQRSPYQRPWVLYPCSFDVDEPVSAVFKAARLMPEITLVITGDVARGSGIHDLTSLPPNVRLLGFISRSDFDRHVCMADIVMGLTTRDDIQLSVANEAVGAGKPVVISDTKLLRNLFYKGTVYVNPTDPASISDGCQHALMNRDSLTAEVEQLRTEKIHRWLGQAEQIDARINSIAAEN